MDRRLVVSVRRLPLRCAAHAHRGLSPTASSVCPRHHRHLYVHEMPAVMWARSRERGRDEQMEHLERMTLSLSYFVYDFLYCLLDNDVET